MKIRIFKHDIFVKIAGLENAFYGLAVLYKAGHKSRFSEWLYFDLGYIEVP